MDYWKNLSVTRHESVEAFVTSIKAEPLLAFSAEGGIPLWRAPFAPGGWLVFGGESRGFSASLRELWKDRLCSIPMEPGARSLNLSTAAAVALYEARRVLSARPA
jgi:tRNA (cytidine/uridine-2'-O-)-methyltransferase